jgi:hypothetical protein
MPQVSVSAGKPRIADETSQADSTVSLLPPAGPQAQGWTGKCKSSHCQCLAEVGIHPLAIGQDRPSRPGPAGEGRSDSRVLHLHPRGQARYPEGGRRREDEPPGKEWRVRAHAGDDEHQGDEQLENCLHPGLPPRTPRLWARRPCFSTTLRPTRTRQDLPCTSAGEPRTPMDRKPERVPHTCHTPRCPTASHGHSRATARRLPGPPLQPTHQATRPIFQAGTMPLARVARSLQRDQLPPRP